MSYEEASSPSRSCRKRVVSSRSGSGESEPSDYRTELAISDHFVQSRFRRWSHLPSDIKPRSKAGGGDNKGQMHARLL